MVYDVLIGKRELEANENSFVAVDVRDVAYAHIAALEKEEAGGKRFIISAVPFTFHQVASILRNNYPNNDKISKPNPAGVSGKGLLLSNEQAEKVLGMKWTSFEQTILDTAKDLERFL
jgi:nucleoside-diphosphate-sugar epimerase